MTVAVRRLYIDSADGKHVADASGADRANVTCGIETGGALVSYWEWSKLIALAFLISCALTAAYIALWWLVLR